MRKKVKISKTEAIQLTINFTDNNSFSSKKITLSNNKGRIISINYSQEIKRKELLNHIIHDEKSF